MLKQSILFILLILVFLSPALGQNKYSKALSFETVNSLEAKGFKVLGMHKSIRPPSRDPDKEEPESEMVQIEVSLDLSRTNIKPIYMGPGLRTGAVTRAATDTILVENFEGEFPGSTWQVSGDPTWGKTDFNVYDGSYSAWCAAGGDSAVTPGNGYPNNMNAMMVLGPFDLSGVNYGELNLQYWLDTEFKKDWFYYMVSTDGNNFVGVGLSGQTGFYSGAWRNDVVPLSNFPGLGDVTGQSQVWLAMLFESDSVATSDKGVLVDDVLLTKRQIPGTPIAGAISGILPRENNPYIVPMNVGIVEGDSLRIDPGVEIQFEESAQFVVLGSLNAIGTPSDSILFTSNMAHPQPGDWPGLGFYDSKDSSRIEYCKTEYGGQGSLSANFFIQNRKVLVAHSLIENSGGPGILCFGSSPIVRQNIIRNNKSAGINSTFGSFGTIGSPRIEENLISENNSGVQILFSGSS